MHSLQDSLCCVDCVDSEVSSGFHHSCLLLFHRNTAIESVSALRALQERFSHYLVAEVVGVLFVCSEAITASIDFAQKIRTTLSLGSSSQNFHLLIHISSMRFLS